MIAGYPRGVALAFATALLWGLSGPIAKLISRDGLSMTSVVAYRCLLVCLLLGIHRARSGRAFILSRRMNAFYAVLGFAAIVCMATGYMFSCVYLSIAQAVMLHYTFPLLTMAGDVFLTRERPPLGQLAAALMILVGVYIGFDVGGGVAGVSLPGFVWGLISVLGFAAQSLLVRHVSRGGMSDPFEQVFYTHAFGGAMLIAGKTLFVGWGDLAGLSPQTFALVQYPALASGLLGFVCMYASLRYISATTMSLICSLEIVFTLLSTPLLLGGAHSARELAGCAVVLASVAAGTLARGSSSKR